MYTGTRTRLHMRTALCIKATKLTPEMHQTPDTFMDQIKQPMLLVWGDEDPLTPLKVGYGPYFAEELVQNRPQTELCVVKAGHCPHDDAVEPVNTAVLEWLSRVPAMSANIAI